MAQIQTQTLKARKELERKQEEQILFALRSRGKAHESAKRDKKNKKKSAGELFAMLNLCGIQNRIIRPAWEYTPRSFNLDRQLHGLLNHLFVRYQVPGFMYR